MISPYGKFYCSNGDRTYGKKSNITNCQFQFTSTTEQTSDGTFVRIKTDQSLILEHNHDLIPVSYSHKLLDDDIINFINTLANAHISPNKIQKVLINRNIYNVSTMQIQSIINRDNIQQFKNQSNDLINYMKSCGGYAECFDLDDEGITKRLAVLTIHKNELENLKNYGDVLFIDGTHAQLQLKWEVIPITAITKDLTICSCGILYTAISNEEILKWLLSKICSFEEVEIFYIF